MSTTGRSTETGTRKRDTARPASDAAIRRQIAADPDTAPELTARDWARARVVVPPGCLDVKAIRRRTGLSQAGFASTYGFSLRTLQKWEQQRRRPNRAARVLLWLIKERPEAVEAALRETV